MLKLLKDKSLRQKIGANAKRLVENKYSWESVTDRLNYLFEEIVTSHKTVKLL